MYRPRDDDRAATTVDFSSVVVDGPRSQSCVALTRADDAQQIETVSGCAVVVVDHVGASKIRWGVLTLTRRPPWMEVNASYVINLMRRIVPPARRFNDSMDLVMHLWSRGRVSVASQLASCADHLSCSLSLHIVDW